MKFKNKKILFPVSLMILLFFSVNVFAANCFLYQKNSYKTKANGTKCWYQSFRTGSTSTPPTGYGNLSSKGIKPDQSCATEFMGYVKGQGQTNSWSCVEARLNGNIVSTKGSP